MDKNQIKKNIAVLCISRCIYSFSFSVIFTSLALYFNTKLGMKEARAAGVTATFLALNYGLRLIAGWLGNHYISFRMLFKTGLILQSFGYLLFSQIKSSNSIYLPLSLMLMGSMVFFCQHS